MDIHSNAVSSGLPEENFPGDNMEGGDGVSLEWLSLFVEECLNGGFTCQQPPSIPPTTTTINPPIITEQSKIPKPPSKMRTKRRRLSPQANNSIPTNSFHVTNFEDSTLLPQAYWLADSELILPKKENEAPKMSTEQEEEVVEISGKEQPRRCTHCLSQKTPQWRAGPVGPKTLCNACGVRFKSGRLLPEYRPAKSPTFESFKHSNSHKKVMEMRMDILSSHTN